MKSLLTLIKTEPALVTGVVQAVIGVVVAFGVTLTTGQSGAVLAVTTALLALIAAVATRPFQVAALTGFGTAVGTLLLAFGVPHVTPGAVAAVNALVTVMAALIVRVHVTPVATLHASPPRPPAPQAPPSAG